VFRRLLKKRGSQFFFPFFISFSFRVFREEDEEGDADIGCEAFSTGC